MRSNSEVGHAIISTPRCRTGHNFTKTATATGGRPRVLTSQARNDRNTRHTARRSNPQAPRRNSPMERVLGLNRERGSRKGFNRPPSSAPGPGVSEAPRRGGPNGPAAGARGLRIHRGSRLLASLSGRGRRDAVSTVSGYVRVSVYEYACTFHSPNVRQQSRAQ